MSLLKDIHRAQLDRLLSAPEDRFDQLAEVAGIDPTRDLRFADLQGVDFSGSVMKGWDFTGADLRGANFRGAQISECIFSDAIGANLAGAIKLRASSNVPGMVGPSWDDVRSFIELARSGSFRSSAERLGVPISSLRPRIEQLESQLGEPLPTRHVDGIRLTQAGQTIFEAAARMERASFDLIRARDRSSPSLRGEVKIAVTEAIGGFWLVPELTRRVRQVPGLLLDFSSASRSADVLRLEADVSVQLQKPTYPDLKLVKLGRIHSMLFGARFYLNTYGRPNNLEELTKHRIALDINDATETQRIYDRLFPGVQQPGFVAVRNNTMVNHFLSISTGAGVGWLPSYISTFIAVPDEHLVPIDIAETRLMHDIWLTYHPDVSRIPRVRRVIDWIIDAFDSRKFPWFGDEFVHPTKIEGELVAARNSWRKVAPLDILEPRPLQASDREEPTSQSVYDEVSRRVRAGGKSDGGPAAVS